MRWRPIVAYHQRPLPARSGQSKISMQLQELLDPHENGGIASSPDIFNRHPLDHPRFVLLGQIDVIPILHEAVTRCAKPAFAAAGLKSETASVANAEASKALSRKSIPAAKR